MTNRRNLLLALAATTALFTMTPGSASAHTIDRPSMMQVLPACEYEDSTNCAWDAGSEGNGAGFSFYDLGGTVHYLNPTLDRWERDGVAYDMVLDRFGLGDALAEGDRPNYDWDACLVAGYDYDMVITCADGTLIH